jgi:NAD(P)H dehydrogenase (quinone)
MKTLIVYAHPNPKSFNHAIADTAERTLREAGHEVRVRDLYAINFNPVLTGQDFEANKAGATLPEVQTEKDHISWADQLLFVCPVWWVGRPAILQGYFDRVLHYGFAYKSGPNGIEGLLKHRKALVFQTTGTPEAVYKPMGMEKTLHMAVDEGVMKFCGIKDVTVKTFYGVPHTTDDNRHHMLDDVEAIVKEFAKAKGQ